MNEPEKVQVERNVSEQEETLAAVYYGEVEQPHNFSLFLTPSPDEGQIYDTLMEILSDGWKDFGSPYAAPRLKRELGLLLHGYVIDRSDNTLIVQKALNPGNSRKDLQAVDIVEEVIDRLPDLREEIERADVAQQKKAPTRKGL